jgi:hypothetical protein
MSDKAYHILKRFQDKRPAITNLMDEDAEFLALCEDYDACVSAFYYWSMSKDGEAEKRVDEYRILIKELEEEIAQALAALKPTGLD